MNIDEIRVLNGTADFPPRPTLTDNDKRALIFEYIQENPNWLEDCDVESCLAALIDSCSISKDSFEIAKDLDKFHGWDTERDDLDHLDSICYKMRRKLEDLQRVWVNENNIQQPLKNGTRIKCLSRGKTGVIQGAYDYKAGCYLVTPDDQPESSTTKWICEFERVVSV
jgi:hypothetical protein